MLSSDVLRRHAHAAALPVVWLLIFVYCYLPDLGHGFIKDDFAWIRAGRFSGWRGLLDVFGRDQGFYRPVVALSFAVNERLFGLDPFWYAASNLLLVLGCVTVLYMVLRSLGIVQAGAGAAAASWAFNPHGIGGSVMWISGRTSLLALFFALLATWALLHRRMVSAVVACTLALLSKEEAALLPLVLALWAAVNLDSPRKDRIRRFFSTFLWLSPALLLYLALRSRTSAFLPWNLPTYYAAASSLGALLRNGLEYLDRTSTFMLTCVVVAALVSWSLPRLIPQEGRWLFLALLWIAGGLATTIWLGVRSSLYAVYPAAGVAIAAGVALGALWRIAAQPARRRLVAAAAIVPLLMLPIERARNDRMVRHAELSARVVSLIRQHQKELASGAVLLLVDTPQQRVNLANTFGTLMDAAAEVTAGLPTGRVRIEPDPGGNPPSSLLEPALTYRLEGSELRWVARSAAPGVLPGAPE